MSNGHTRENLPHHLNRTVVLLTLLYSPGSTGRPNEPVSGRTRLQKQVFLLQEDLRASGVKGFYSFRPYKLGPMSYDLYNDIDWLKFEGVLKEEKQVLPSGTEFSVFSLTEKGINEVRRHLADQTWKTVLDRVSKVKKATNSINLSYLVQSVHESHPKYVLDTPVTRLLESLSSAIELSPTETAPEFTPRKHKTLTSATEDIRALRARRDTY